MLIDKERRFLLQLSLALHVPVKELEDYPASVIQEYKALNLVSPFINDSNLIREGLVIQYLRNQNVSKKSDYRTYDQLLPYLQDYPSFIEERDVKKVLSSIGIIPDEVILEAIEEELETSEDDYVITRLKQIQSQIKTKIKPSEE